MSVLEVSVVDQRPTAARLDEETWGAVAGVGTKNSASHLGRRHPSGAPERRVDFT